MKLKKYEMIVRLCRNQLLLGALFMASVTVFAVEESDYIYRYIGSQGEMVIDDYIPPEFIPKGYSILTSKGVLIETIAPALTKEERDSQSAQMRDLTQRKIREKWLLERYSDADDAIISRDRKLELIDTLIIGLRNKIKKLKTEETKELEFAAQSERNGREVSETTIKRLESIRSQISMTEKEIKNKEQEKQKTKDSFNQVVNEMHEIDKRKKNR